MDPIPPPLTTGSRFAEGYEIEAELGSGALSRVYRARQLSTEQSVAIKLLSLGEGASSTGREAQRFRRETQICATLSHTNIVRLIDSGETHDGQLYTVFELVPGETLEQALHRERQLAVRESLRLMTQVLEALACAHEQGVVHRDLKPANLMLSRSGARRNALVLDFGLGGVAEGRHRAAWQTLTQSGTFLGTPLYAAPEQLAGEPATARSDLYAWGLVLLECLTGRHPFVGGDALLRDRVEIPDWLRGHRLGALLEEVTARAAAQRDVSAEALIETLDEIARGELPAAPEAPEIDTPPPLSQRGERRHLTVMFCDLVDSAGLTQRLGAEAYRQVVQSAQASAAEAVERHGGHVAQYLGDGLLVYFGHPQAHEDDAARAVRAGREVLRQLQLMNPRLEAEHGVRPSMRIGIHSGPVVVSEIGAGEKKEVLALGDTPTIAARLEALAEPDTLVISEATARLVAGLFATEDLGTPALKGISEPVRVYRVLQPSGVTSRLDRAPRLTPFVGRQQELGLLLDRFEEAGESRGQAVLIGGEAGIGKSRLVHQLHERLGEAPHGWLECRCTPYTQSSALYPVIELLERVLGFEPEDTSDEKVSRLEGELARAGLEPAEAVPLFASLLSLRLAERYAPLEISPQRQRQKTIEALLAWLLALGERQPAVLLVEDLHWIDPSTKEWLGLVIEQCPTAGVLVLLTHRPEFESPWPAREHVLQIGLTRLRAREAKRLVAEAVWEGTLPDELIDRLAKRSDGIPLFVEELAKGVVESDRGVSLSDLEIPETVKDLLTERLDRLGEARQVAQLGAALGREFPYALLEAVAPLREAPLQEGLARLVAAELLYERGLPPAATYMFKHALVQDAAYASLLESQRKELHGRIADALEQRLPERVTREPEEIGRHCAEAGRVEDAFAHYMRAAEHATLRGAYAEAVDHLDTARELLEGLPESTARDRQELSLQEKLAGALSVTRGLSSPEAGQAYVRARHLSERLGDDSELFRALFGVHEFHLVRAEHATARELGEEMLERAERTRDAEQLLVAHWMRGTDLWMDGEFSRALEHLEAGIGFYDPQDYGAHVYRYTRIDPGVAVVIYSSGVLWFLGYPSQALTRLGEARALTQGISHAFSQANVFLIAAGVHLSRREPRAALEEAQALMDFSQEHGFSGHFAYGALRRAQALILLGQLDEGIATLRTIHEAMRASFAELWSADVLVNLAEAVAKAGRVEEGLDLVAEAQAFVTRTGYRSCEALVHRVKGDLLLALPVPDRTGAELAFREAIEVARRQRARSLELCAATHLASLLRNQGRGEEGHALLQPIYDWFTEGFDTLDLQDAKALLEEL